ncbi:MAG: hypothetical protein HYT71_03780 [Candidatus Aenigmarchaeota archaeon]|nr:hypothetical protein [Candidatus Aenigmarchaeota archaeon]
MSDVLITASMITAFVAGIAALFAPCCITVLLPAYLGSIFRQKRTIFLMTFIFFLGLLAVFLPLGLGMAGIGKFFKDYHNGLFLAGSAFFLVLGLSILLGRHFSFPFSINMNFKVKDAGSVFVLGIFSAFATLCCAPVLAGVMALSVLPGSLFWGSVYSLMYVLGMTIPLFVLAYFFDKSEISERMSIFRKKISYNLLGRKVSITVSEALSGGMFVFMGIVLVYLTYTNQLAMGGDYQTSINMQVANIAEFLKNFIGSIPSITWIILVIVALYAIVKIAMKENKKSRTNLDKFFDYFRT